MHINHCYFQIFDNHSAHGLLGVSLVKPVYKEPASGSYVVFVDRIVFCQYFFDIFIADLEHAFLGAFAIDYDFVGN